MASMFSGVPFASMMLLVTATAQSTTRVSTDSPGAQANGASFAASLGPHERLPNDPPRLVDRERALLPPRARIRHAVAREEHEHLPGREVGRIRFEASISCHSNDPSALECVGGTR